MNADINFAYEESLNTRKGTKLFRYTKLLHASSLAGTCETSAGTLAFRAKQERARCDEKHSHQVVSPVRTVATRADGATTVLQREFAKFLD